VGTAGTIEDDKRKGPLDPRTRGRGVQVARQGDGGFTLSGMDYRALLVKYINHVGYEEGSTFLVHQGHEIEFTDEEWAELQVLDAEVNRENSPQAIATEKRPYYDSFFNPAVDA